MCCRCVNLVVLAGLLGSLAYLSVNMYERYLFQRTFECMKSSLDDMQRVVAGIGHAYDDLHEELDMLTGQTIPKTFLIDEEANYKGDDKESVTQSLSYTMTTNEAKSDSKLTLHRRHQFNEGTQLKTSSAKQLVDSNNKLGLSPSSECTKKCMFLPVGEYCGRENCKNKDVYSDMEPLKNEFKESKINENGPEIVDSSSVQRNSNAGRNKYFKNEHIGIRPSSYQRNSKADRKISVEVPSNINENGPEIIDSSSDQRNSNAGRNKYFKNEHIGIRPSSYQRNSKADRKISVEVPSTIPSKSKRKTSDAKIKKTPVKKSLGEKGQLGIWCSESKCNCGSSCQARKKSNTN